MDRTLVPPTREAAVPDAHRDAMAQLDVYMRSLSITNGYIIGYKLKVDQVGDRQV